MNKIYLGTFLVMFSGAFIMSYIVTKKNLSEFSDASVRKGGFVCSYISYQPPYRGSAGGRGYVSITSNTQNLGRRISLPTPPMLASFRTVFNVKHPHGNTFLNAQWNVDYQVDHRSRKCAVNSAWYSILNN